MLNKTQPLAVDFNQELLQSSNRDLQQEMLAQVEFKSCLCEMFWSLGIRQELNQVALVVGDGEFLNHEKIAKRTKKSQWSKSKEI